MNYQEALKFVHSRRQFKKHPNLDTMRVFLNALNNPQEDIHSVHVAGTNGKGSTVAFLRNIFQQDNQTVGTFTSPFLIKFNERISVNGEPISDDEVISLVSTVQPIVESLDQQFPDGGPTEFEIVTAMMFVYFAKHPVDVVIVEVGIGGLLDSTNVLSSDVSVITTIGMDHMQILGDSIDKIAFQKAGIIKSHQPVVVGKMSDDALTVIELQSAKMNSHLNVLGKDYFIKAKSFRHDWQETFDYEDDNFILKTLDIHLLGEYQMNNAACAINAYIQYQKIYGKTVNPAAIRRGLLNTTWAGRFEKINDSPLVVLDGAHNIDAMNELVKLLSGPFKSTEVFVIIAILADKNYMEMLRVLAKLPNVHLILTEFQAYGSRKAVNMLKIMNNIVAANSVEFVEDWREAIVTTSRQMSSNDMMLITGSLYFISDVRKIFITK